MRFDRMAIVAFLAVVALAAPASAQQHPKRSAKICKLSEPLILSNGRTTSVAGCSTTSLEEPVHQLQYSVSCNYVGQSDRCQFSTFLSSGAACQANRPIVPDGFLKASVCSSSSEPDGNCNRALQVPAGLQDAFTDVCLVVSCLSEPSCSVNATIRLDARKAPVKMGASIEEGSGQDYLRHKPWQRSIFVWCGVGVVFIVAVAACAYIVVRRQRRSREQKNLNRNRDGIWVSGR